MCQRPADGFRFDVHHPDEESFSLSDSDPIRGLSRVTQRDHWEPGRIITITPVWSQDPIE